MLTNDGMLQTLIEIDSLKEQMHNLKLRLRKLETGLDYYDNFINKNDGFITDSCLNIIQAISAFLDPIDVEYILREYFKRNIDIAFEYISSCPYRLKPISEEELDKTLDCAINVIKNDKDKIKELTQMHNLNLKEKHRNKISQILYHYYQIKIYDINSASKYLSYSCDSKIGLEMAIKYLMNDVDELMQIFDISFYNNCIKYYGPIDKNLKKEIFNTVGEEVFKKLRRSLHPLMCYYYFFQELLTEKQLKAITDRVIGHKDEEYAKEIINQTNISQKFKDKLNSFLIFKKLS